MNKNNIISLEKGQKNKNQLLAVENGLLGFLSQHKLPTDNIFAPVSERSIVFKNIEDVIEKLDIEGQMGSIYISKFVAAIATGLFDAGLNYIWDETILQTRKRVLQYDLSYFYDNAITGNKRGDFKSEEDIIKLNDYDLIKGAKEIGLISGLGFKHLEYINYMRNWASAAHPNQNELTGLQLIGWLETCIKEIISLPLSNTTIEIAQLLSAIKQNEISEKEDTDITIFFTKLSQEQANNLASGFWGIYTSIESEQKIRKNIILLFPKLWDYIDNNTKYSFGLKFANFAANHQLDKKRLALELLDLVDGQSYIPEDLRIGKINVAIDNLLISHKGKDNFYSEPTFVEQLERIIGNPPKIPKAIEKKYVYSIVHVFLTNGFGIARNAEPTYITLIKNFNELQSSIAILSFSSIEISSKLQFDLCKENFLRLISLAKASITKPAMLEVIDIVEKHPKEYMADLMKNPKIKLAVENLKIIWT